MPKLDSRNFNKVQLIPIVFDQKQMHIPNPFYLIHNSEMYQVNSVTKQITYLDDQHLFINSLMNFTLTSNCGITNRTLSGSFLLHFNNCHVNINNVLYDKRTQTLPGKPIQLPLNGIEIKMHQEILNISLEHLHKLQQQTRKELGKIRLSSISLHWPHWSLIGGISFSPFIIASTILLCYFRKRTIINNLPQISKGITSRTITNNFPQISKEIKSGHQQTIFRNLSPAELIQMEPHH